MGEQMLESKSETISVSDQRKLREITHELGGLLTQREYSTIAQVYAMAIERLLIENGMEL